MSTKEGEFESWFGGRWRPPPWRPVANAFVGPLLLFLLLHGLTKSTKLSWDNGSFGAAAVILFSLPHSSAALPRNAFFGQMLSAMVTFAFGYLLPGKSIVWVRTALAVSTSAMLMKMLGMSYPPGGATAFILAQEDIKAMPVGIMFRYLLFPLLVGTAILVILALVLNNFLLRERYPNVWI